MLIALCVIGGLLAAIVALKLLSPLGSYGLTELSELAQEHRAVESFLRPFIRQGTPLRGWHLARAGRIAARRERRLQREAASAEEHRKKNVAIERLRSRYGKR